MSGTLGIKAARIAIVLAVFALWETLSRTGMVNPRLLPSASDSFAMLWELLQRASVRNDLVVTASEVATAFVLAVPVGGGGLVPNLLAGNVDAAVVYSPLSFQIAKSGEARTILDYARDVPPSLTSGWIATDKYAKEKPEALQKALNALYGGVMFMRNNREAAIKLIAELYEMPAEIAAAEYENTILKLETDGNMSAPNVTEALQLSLDMAKLGGMKDLVPAPDIISTGFKPVATRP